MRDDRSPFLLPCHLADLLGFSSERAARDWIHRERVPFVRVGRHVGVLRDSLLEFLKTREETDGALTDAPGSSRVARRSKGGTRRGRVPASP